MTYRCRHTHKSLIQTRSLWALAGSCNVIAMPWSGMRRKHIEAAWRAIILNQPLNEALLAVGYGKSASYRPKDFVRMSKALQVAFETIADLSHRFAGVPPKCR